MPPQRVEELPCCLARLDAAQKINPQKRAAPRKKARKTSIKDLTGYLGAPIHHAHAARGAQVLRAALCL
jgi:hypothetical protein